MGNFKEIAPRRLRPEIAGQRARGNEFQPEDLRHALRVRHFRVGEGVEIRPLQQRRPLHGQPERAGAERQALPGRQVEESLVRRSGDGRRLSGIHRKRGVRGKGQGL